MQHNIEHDIEQGEDSLPADFLHIEADRESNGTSGLSWFIQRWRAISRRFQANTFSPGFLASPWSHPAFSYFFAILGQVGAVAVITLILRAFPNFHFSSSLILLVVLLAALGWGAGPSLVATLAGTFLFISFFTPPYFSITPAHVEDLIGASLFTCVGLIISILASRVQRAFYRAQTLSARLETIIEAIPDSVVIYNRQGDAVQWNPATRMIGTIKTPDTPFPEMPEQLDLRDLQGKKLGLEELPLARALRGEIVRNGEMAYKTVVEQQDRFVSVSAAPLCDPRNGIIEGAITITRDLSPPGHAKQQAAEQASQLEAIFESTTDQLLVYDRQGKLVCSNEASRLLCEREEVRARAMALQIARERMDTFIGIAGHELKTPLTAIKGNLQLVIRRLNNILKEGSGGDVVALSKLEAMPAMLERAERHVNMLTRLVRDLVEVSRIQAGKLELRLAPCDLASIVREIVADYRDNVPNRVVRLKLEEGAAVPIMADADHVSQVASNYLSNALKYSEADRPVEVHLEVSGPQARFSVRDEGPGLSAEEQQRVWERFYRVPDVEVQSGSEVGLGLGLHISRTIIEEQGGHVGVESTPGEGSTFWFTLPLTIGDPE